MSIAQQLLLQIEEDFQQLRKEYTMFLNDISQVEPIELRTGMMNRVKRLRNLSNLKTEEQFRCNNLISKIHSHTQLWDRQVERKYLGDPRLKKPKKTSQAPPKPKESGVVIKDPAAQREQVSNLYEEYTRLNLIVGSRKMVNFSKFQNFIESQTSKLKDKKGAKSVRYEVIVQDNKVVIKSKSVR